MFQPWACVVVDLDVAGQNFFDQGPQLRAVRNRHWRQGFGERGENAVPLFADHRQLIPVLQAGGVTHQPSQFGGFSVLIQNRHTNLGRLFVGRRDLDPSPVQFPQQSHDFIQCGGVVLEVGPQ